jgi:hypothetical protein
MLGVSMWDQNIAASTDRRGRGRYSRYRGDVGVKVGCMPIEINLKIFFIKKLKYFPFVNIFD